MPNYHLYNFILHKALKNVVENGIPIIFITLPETKAAIEQLDNNAKTALRRALKVIEIFYSEVCSTCSTGKTKISH